LSQKPDILSGMSGFLAENLPQDEILSQKDFLF